MTIKEAEELFEQADVAFSTTTIWRMCQKDKNDISRLEGSFQELQLENERNKGMLNVYQTNWSSLQDVIGTVLDTAFNKVSGRTSLEAPREFGQGEERENHEDKEKREDESKRVFP